MLETAESLQAEGRWRETQVLAEKDFCSNDYLGLSHDRELRETLIRHLQTSETIAASASRLIPGHHNEHESAEIEFARHFGSESGLIFNSGYAANLSLLKLFGRDHHVFSDELNHASMIDGIRSARADKTIFKHNDVDDLRRKLADSDSSRKVIVTESVFSMDGDLAPLTALYELAREHGAHLILDEAHATGVFGPGGAGLATDQNLPAKHVTRVFTFGKALASFGAFIACSNELRDLLVNTSREFIYSTALPPHLIFQTRAALKEIHRRPELQTRLQKNIQFFSEKLSLNNHRSAIVPLRVSGNQNVLDTQRICREAGFEVSAIRYPTVARGEERLRVCIHSNHTQEDLADLAHILERFL